MHGVATKTLSGSFQARDYVQSVEEVARSAQRLESDVRENPAAWNLDLEAQLWLTSDSSCGLETFSQPN